MSRKEVVCCEKLPDSPNANIVYKLLPRNAPADYYRERTDRNMGWITKDEQEILRNATVGIAGCGGMGGLVGQTLVRLGVGEIRIADCEEFDISNINRQFGATKETVGKSKAFVTAQKIRETSDDATVVVYPQGITEGTVNHFLDGCDIICDEIELLVLDARILLHQRARHLGISLFNCNTVGFSTNLFLYTPHSTTIEETTGISYEEALELGREINAGNRNSLLRIVNAMMRAVVPNLPEYSPNEPGANKAKFYSRVLDELKAPIIATNPPMASGFLSNRVLLYLLQNSGVKRNIVSTPDMPGYLHFDAATMTATVSINKKWWKV